MFHMTNTGDKLDEVLEKHELTEYGEEITRVWTMSDKENRKSVRELETEVNTRILEAIIDDAIDRPVSEVDLLFPLRELQRLIRAKYSDANQFDDITPIRIKPAVDWLVDQGLSPKDINDDMVSYSTIYGWLTEQDATPPKDTSPYPYRDIDSPAEGQSVAKERIVSIKRDTYARIDSELNNLQELNIIPTKNFDIAVSIEITCPRCGTRSRVDEFINNRGCPTPEYDFTAHNINYNTTQ